MSIGSSHSSLVTGHLPGHSVTGHLPGHSADAGDGGSTTLCASAPSAVKNSGTSTAENAEQRGGKRKRAKKIRQPLGPYQTAAVSFDRGTRAIEIVRINPSGITYRLKGRSEQYTLPHGVAFLKAVSLGAGFDTGPRESKQIRRGSQARTNFKRVRVALS
jgi:hypothetical protein